MLIETAISVLAMVTSSMAKKIEENEEERLLG